MLSSSKKRQKSALGHPAPSSAATLDPIQYQTQNIMAPLVQKGAKNGNRPQSAPRYDGFRRNHPRFKGLKQYSKEGGIIDNQTFGGEGGQDDTEAFNNLNS